MILFFLFALALMASAIAYIGRRIIRPLPAGERMKSILWGLLTLPFALPVLAMLTRRYTGLIWDSTPLPWFAYLGMGYLSFVLTLLLFRDMFALDVAIFRRIAPYILRWAGRKPRASLSPPPWPRGYGPNTTNLVILGIAALLTIGGVFNASRVPRAREVPVPVRGLPAAFEGFRIVQITDIHAGPTLRRKFVEGVVRRIPPLEPDMIVLTGDLADGTVKQLTDDVASLTALSAPHGMFFVTGNHEYYFETEAWLSKVRRLGFQPLMNEYRVIRRGDDAILIAGVTDYSAGHFIPEQASSPAKAFRGAPALATKILLAHQPRTIYAASELGVDLQISGHTHGGQFFPWQPFIYLEQPYVAGMHRFHDTLVYTSRGAGYWGPPLRLGASSEITLFILLPSE